MKEMELERGQRERVCVSLSVSFERGEKMSKLDR